MSLSDEFPQLPFAKAADGWLNKLRSEKLSIKEQLSSRGISTVRLQPVSWPSYLAIKGKDLSVWLCDARTPEENAEALGYELGHTFHWELLPKPRNLCDPDRMKTEDYNPIKLFCHAFSRQWLEINDKAAVTDYFLTLRVLTRT